MNARQTIDGTHSATHYSSCFSGGSRRPRERASWLGAVERTLPVMQLGCELRMLSRSQIHALVI